MPAACFCICVELGPAQLRPILTVVVDGIVDHTRTGRLAMTLPRIEWPEMGLILETTRNMLLSPLCLGSAVACNHSAHKKQC